MVVRPSRRAGSSKHPKGFIAPTTEDLTELRERVQEFTREYALPSVMSNADRRRPRDTRRGCRPDRPDECLSQRTLAADGRCRVRLTIHDLDGADVASLLGITADEDFGGLAMGYQAHCTVLEELSRASGQFLPLPVKVLADMWTGSIGLSYAAHSQLCINQLSLHGTPEQKQRFLPELISGTSVGALAMSEHGAGSDVMSMKTTAKEVDGGFVLNGTKMWITNVRSPILA